MLVIVRRTRVHRKRVSIVSILEPTHVRPEGCGDAPERIKGFGYSVIGPNDECSDHYTFIITVQFHRSDGLEESRTRSAI